MYFHKFLNDMQRDIYIYILPSVTFAHFTVAGPKCCNEWHLWVTEDARSIFMLYWQ